MNSIDGDGALIKQLKFIAQGIVVISNASEPLTLLKRLRIAKWCTSAKEQLFQECLAAWDRYNQTNSEKVTYKRCTNVLTRMLLE